MIYIYIYICIYFTLLIILRIDSDDECSTLENSQGDEDYSLSESDKSSESSDDVMEMDSDDDLTVHQELNCEVLETHDPIEEVGFVEETLMPELRKVIVIEDDGDISPQKQV